ncbi:MAG: hypothetical protein IJI51_03300 [Lachnospiraceae bacterium]|nr:hypothetical protein [Lachnospiraceae bacterium]
MGNILDSTILTLKARLKEMEFAEPCDRINVLNLIDEVVADMAYYEGMPATAMNIEPDECYETYLMSIAYDDFPEDYQYAEVI